MRNAGVRAYWMVTPEHAAHAIPALPISCVANGQMREDDEREKRENRTQVVARPAPALRNTYVF